MQTKQPRWVQYLLLYFLLTNSVPGIWALFIPDSFYHHFPGFGRTWISIDGPYNEHLIRDVGAFFLALATLCLLALWLPHLVNARVVSICLLVFNTPHLWYHLHHLHKLQFADQIGNVVALSAAVLLCIPLLFYRSSVYQPLTDPS